MENKNRHHENWQSKLPKGSGFEVPEGYFDQVEDQFSAKLREASLPKSSGFEVPEGYFNTLEDKILENVELPKKGKVISLKSRIIQISSVAAAIAILFVSYLIFFESIDEEPTFEEIAVWIDTNISDVETEDLVNLLETDENLDDSFFDTSIENNNIEKYLDENDTYILIEESQGLFDEIN